MGFDPKPEYEVVTDRINLRDFSAYAEEFVVRPPYQRKSVWTRQRQQSLLDSIFRRFYIPRIVLREVRLDDQRTVREVIDGQQRINTAQLFVEDNLALPKTLGDLSQDMVGKKYSQLSSDLRRFVDRLSYEADIVKGIENPKDPRHQEVASEIFWRLQLGEPLNFMEIAHARLASLTRNFIVKYADDIDFDYESYKPIDENPHKHRFFRIVDMNNGRMQHLALLTRLLLLERAGGPADLQETHVREFIDEHKTKNGIGDLSYESDPVAQSALKTMNAFYEVFKDDYMHTGDEPIKELRREYFVISMYLLLRHLLAHYVFDGAESKLFHDFLVSFHERWAARSEDDNEILNFSDHRQQSGNEIEFRHRVLRQLFFEYAAEQGQQMLTKDERRAFNEAERIAIYRHDNGLCQICLQEGKPEPEARVTWSKYEADHVLPHSRGGQTHAGNAQVLCGYHNAQKGGQAPAPAEIETG